MSVTDITRMEFMGRWEPDARGRLVQSALELYAEQGFEQTTALQVAERAGVTERTFFRHFSDKREVLFQASADLQALVVSAIAAAPQSMSPIDVVGGAMESAASVLEGNRSHSQRRAQVIAANASLQERELLKLSTLGIGVAAALRERGIPELAANLLAEMGVTVFKVGFETWIDPATTATFAECIHDALVELRVLTGA